VEKIRELILLIHDVVSRLLLPPEAAGTGES
jgi:hypothetical protein